MSPASHVHSIPMCVFDAIDVAPGHIIALGPHEEVQYVRGRTPLWRDQDALDPELLDSRPREPQPARCGGADA